MKIEKRIHVHMISSPPDDWRIREYDHGRRGVFKTCILLTCNILQNKIDYVRKKMAAY